MSTQDDLLSERDVMIGKSMNGGAMISYNGGVLWQPMPDMLELALNGQVAALEEIQKLTGIQDALPLKEFSREPQKDAKLVGDGFESLFGG